MRGFMVSSLRRGHANLIYVDENLTQIRRGTAGGTCDGKSAVHPRNLRLWFRD